MNSIIFLKNMNNNLTKQEYLRVKYLDSNPIWLTLLLIDRRIILIWLFLRIFPNNQEFYWGYFLSNSKNICFIQLLWLKKNKRNSKQYQFVLKKWWILKNQTFHKVKHIYILIINIDENMTFFLFLKSFGRINYSVFYLFNNLKELIFPLNLNSNWIWLFLLYQLWKAEFIINLKQLVINHFSISI
jgi:hypothetical protein